MLSRSKNIVVMVSLQKDKLGFFDFVVCDRVNQF